MSFGRRRAIRRVALVAFAVTCLFTQASHALTADEVSRLKSREALVNVSPDTAGADGVVEAAIEIASPPARVWDVMLDCARAPNFMPALKACNVLDADPAGAWDVREHRVSWLAILPDTLSVFRSDYTKHQLISFARTGGDFKILEGFWRLEPIDGGKRTRLFYRARIGVALPVPAFLLRGALESDVPKFLNALRTEVERS